MFVVVAFLIILIAIAYWLTMVFMLKRSVPMLKAHWEAHNNDAPKENELIYVVFGDSTAQGVGTKLVHQSYPSIIAEWLEKQTARPTRIINLSVSGAKVSDVFQEQLPAMFRLGPPHIVTIAIGANDLDHFVPEEFESTMQDIVRALPRESYVATLPTFGGRHKSQDWKAEEASKIIRNAVKGTNHHLVDLYTETSGNKGLRYHAADLFHPNHKAYKAWALAFEKVMAERIPQLLILKK